MWWALKACERLPFLSLDAFYQADREEQILLMVYAQERDQEEGERTLGSLGGGKTKAVGRAKDKIKDMKFRKKSPTRRSQSGRSK